MNCHRRDGESLRRTGVMDPGTRSVVERVGPPSRACCDGVRTTATLFIGVHVCADMARMSSAVPWYGSVQRATHAFTVLARFPDAPAATRGSRHAWARALIYVF